MDQQDVPFKAEYLGSRLRKIRGNESRPSFAERFGVHKGTIERYEKGLGVPDAEFVAKLIEFEGINANWLLTGEGMMYLNRTRDRRNVGSSSGVREPAVAGLAVQAEGTWRDVSERIRRASRALKEAEQTLGVEPPELVHEALKALLVERYDDYIDLVKGALEDIKQIRDKAGKEKI
jgi:transcriptional regulator with XRE-family HTH domain